MKLYENNYNILTAGITQARSVETHKQSLKADRHIKEMQFTADENRKNIERMSDLVDKLQTKIRTYKKQIEDAEEIAALNLAKFRKTQQQLEDAEERSRHAEGNLIRMRGVEPGTAGARLSFDFNNGLGSF